MTATNIYILYLSSAVYKYKAVCSFQPFSIYIPDVNLPHGLSSLPWLIFFSIDERADNAIDLIYPQTED